MSVFRKPELLEINIGWNILKQTREFKYLGSMFSEDRRLDREIETHCQKSNAVFYQLAPLLRYKNIPVSIKAKLISAKFLPTLTYQSQT